MAVSSDQQRFRNEDLILQVSPSVRRDQWDESQYEAFIDALCGDREYQKIAIKTALRYLLGGEYENLLALAKENHGTNPNLGKRYGSWTGFERHLQFPEKLSASLDLATGTGKSYVLYGLAAIMLAEGIVDKVLVLCPSTTIELGLIEKFRDLASDRDLRDLLPADSKITAPQIINASESIVTGDICVENYHAVLQHVGSSIRDSLHGEGERVLVLNDEAHHVANESAAQVKRWKEFLSDPDFNFRYIIGVSGTCYIKDEYFSDVIFRYSLRQAMEEKYVKKVSYIAEMPKTGEPNEKWQLVYNRHEENRKKLSRRSILPLTIIVTKTIERCKDISEELKHFLIDYERVDPDLATDQILTVYNNAPDIIRLPYVDQNNSKVEWIVAVSMLNEGWDVKRVFQIVPHEERAFNSKLLIAQVLGRGLRVPLGWHGEQPEVTVFNHDAWAPRIRHLVNEILEIERRLSSRVIDDSPHNFELHNIDYTLQPTSITKPMTGGYTLFSKGYIDLATELPNEDINVQFEQADTGSTYKWQTQIKHKTYTPEEIAQTMYQRLEEAQDPDDLDEEMRTYYTDNYPVEKLEQIVKKSLEELKITKATESMRQKFLQSLGTLRRKASENVRYTPLVNRYTKIVCSVRPADSVSAVELRSYKTYFFTGQTRSFLTEEQLEFFDEVAEPGSGFKVVRIQNHYDFKTPLNAAIADSENERKFINMLFDPVNLPHYEAWIKSTSTRFYEIEYAWKKGNAPKRGKFSPDFFIKTQDFILVVEIKGNEELSDPSEENRKKNEYADAHFKRVNQYLEEEGEVIRYKFNFLTPRDFNTYFQALREGNIEHFRSYLDVRLATED